MKRKTITNRFYLIMVAVAGLSAPCGFGADPAGVRERNGAEAENEVTGRHSVIGGGRKNAVAGNDSTVGGGANNVVLGKGAVISGGEDNEGGGLHSSIGGGRQNKAMEPGATVAGGAENMAFGQDSAIGGGYKNQVLKYGGVIGGGLENVARSEFGVVGGGHQNLASGSFASVSGGEKNHAAGANSYIGGGRQNLASGINSAVLGGVDNEANGISSVALGYRAKVDHKGAFVFSDSGEADFNSITDNEFAVRAEQLRLQRGSLRINSEVRSTVGDGAAVGAESRRLITLTTPGFAAGGIWSWDVDQGGALVLARDGALTRAALAPDKGGWLHPSDRRLKRDLQPATGMLEKVEQLEVKRYRLKSGGADAPVQLGLVAQEVEPVLPELVDRVGDNLAVGYDRMGVVAIGAVKELSSRNQHEIADLRRQNAALRRSLAAMMKRLEQLEEAKD